MRLSPLALLALTAALGAQTPLTTQRIFASREFAPQRAPQTRWLDDSTFTALEPSPAGAGEDLVRIAAATGAKTTLVTAAQLTPAPGAPPLAVEDYDWSPDHTKLLIFTNSARVWRAEYPRRFLGPRSREPSPPPARRHRRARAAVHDAVREILPRRQARGLRVGAQSVRRECRRRPHHPAHRRRLRHHDQWHLRLGVRGRTRPAGRIPLEPRRHAHRVLAARCHRRPRFPPDQQHRFALLVREAHSISQGGHHEFRRAAGRRQRVGRAHHVAPDPRRSAQ